MTIYRWFWRAFWLPIGAVCGGVGLLLGPVAGVVAATVVYGLLGGLVAAALASCDQAPSASSSNGARLYVLRIGGWAALAGGLLQVWTAVLGSTAWPVVALAALTSPQMVALVVHWSPMPEHRHGVVPAAASCHCGCTEPVSAGEMAGVLSVLDDQQLCRAWQASFSQLRTAPSAAARLQVAMVRHAYLEELERRDDDGLRRWLASGPRPTSGPEEYWRPGPARVSEDQPGSA